MPGEGTCRDTPAPRDDSPRHAHTPLLTKYLSSYPGLSCSWTVRLTGPLSRVKNSRGKGGDDKFKTSSAYTVSPSSWKVFGSCKSHLSAGSRGAQVFPGGCKLSTSSPDHTTRLSQAHRPAHRLPAEGAPATWPLRCPRPRRLPCRLLGKDVGPGANNLLHLTLSSIVPSHFFSNRSNPA